MDQVLYEPHHAWGEVFATVGFLLAHHHAANAPPRRTRISVGPRNISAALAVRAILATNASAPPPVHWLHRMDQRKVGRVGEAGHIDVPGGIEGNGVGRLIVLPAKRGGKKQ